MTLRVLVTNDDGIDSVGLRTLVAVLVEHGYEPIVVAPDADYSGAGTSLISQTSTLFTGGKRELPYERRVLDEAPGVEAWAVGAPPAMCTLLSMRGAFGDRPDMVASGINFGLNTGPSVRHSGTVSAALTAAGFGVPALALSAQYNFEEPDAPLRFDTAAAVGMQVLGAMAATGGHAVLNLNVPRCSLDELAGVRSASISTVTGFHSFVENRTDTMLEIGYKVLDGPMPEGSDSALVSAGFAAVSSLVGVSALACDDVIDRLVEAAV